MKKFLKLIMGATLSLGLLTACSSSSDNSSSTSSSSDAIKIGIIQYAEHPALDATRDGFITEILASGIAPESIEVQNAQGEQPNCATIANKFANDKVDLILAIATPAAQAAAQATSSIPILATAVTDFEVAGLTSSNISGTSDMSPIAEQIELITKIVPDVETVGIMYCSSEDNSILQAEIAKEELDSLGIAYQTFTAADTNEVQQVVQSAVGKVDAIYIPTDNLFAQTMSTVSMITGSAKIPVICGDSGMAGIATYAIDYEKLGMQTGEQAIRILLEGADISTMPVEFSPEESLKMSINEEMFELCGIEIPEDLQ